MNARSLRDRLSAIPSGAGALFFIQMFSTLGFVVLYSSLVLYSTNHLSFSAAEATAILGVFGAFNYGLHLFGGYLGGRYLSNRNLFVGGMALQVLGCASIAGGTEALLYWGLALFLTGSGLNVTCLNMMLTQRFKPDDPRREGAFIWNYAGMNVGFFVGFAVAGHYELVEDYQSMFLFATLGNVLSIVLSLAYWKSLRDVDTPLVTAEPKRFRQRLWVGIAVLVGLVPIVWALLQTEWTSVAMKFLGLLVFFALVYLTVRHEDKREKNNMWAYLILTLGSLVFWALYQMAPSGLQLFADNNVDLRVWGVEVAPQWVQNINTVTIVIGGPLMSMLFVRLRGRGWTIDVPRQFAASLLLMAIGFLVLPLGIELVGADGRVAFVWLFVSYLLQSVGELLISPIGYAMIGRLAPQRYQGIMMGAWMMVTGVASLFAADFSSQVPTPGPEMPLAYTNAVYSELFANLGWGALVVAVTLGVLSPFLRKLIRDEAPEASPVAVAEAA